MRLVDSYEASKILGVTQQTLRRYIKKGKVNIERFSYSGRHLFDADKLEKLAGVNNKIPASEAASLLCLTPSSFSTCVGKGLLKKVDRTLGGRYLFDKDELLEVMDRFDISPDTIFITKKELMEKTNLSYKQITHLQDIGVIKTTQYVDNTPAYFRESDINKIISYMESKDNVEN